MGHADHLPGQAESLAQGEEREGALSRNDESPPTAQKNCHGSRTPSSPPRALSNSSVGIMVRKAPRKSTATSTIGCAVNWLTRRIGRGVRQSEIPASPMMASSRRGACSKATAATTPTSQRPLRPPSMLRGSRDGEEHRHEGQHGIERERNRHGASLLP